VRRGRLFLLALCGVALAVVADSAGALDLTPRTARAGARFSSWRIEGGEAEQSVRQAWLPIEIGLEPLPGGEVSLGFDLRHQEMEGSPSAKSSGVGAGWLNARHRVDHRWILGLGAVVPLRDPSLTGEEMRLASLLEETGLRMPVGGLAPGPGVEARALRMIPLGAVHKAGVAAGILIRAPYRAARGEGSLDPGDRLRLAAALNGPYQGVHWSLTAAGTTEGNSKLRGVDRYREGERLDLALGLSRPGNLSLESLLRLFLQAEGEASVGWAAPSGGSVLSGGIQTAWGDDWRWRAALTAWRYEGFDDLIADPVVLRPSVGLLKRWGRQGIEGSIAPALGSAREGRSLRGLEVSFLWSLGQ